jgi:hypothetical protein
MPRSRLRTWRELVPENLLSRQQLTVALRARPRPPLRRRDWLIWCLVRRSGVDWRGHLMLVRPETVLRWHRRAWSLVWWWRSRRPVGRPRVSQAVRELIARMWRDNRLWGTERIRGELGTLGVTVSAGSVRRSRWRGPARPSSPTWRTFLANYAAQLWAADLFTLPTLTFRTLYVRFFLTHDRRELVHIRVTAHPTVAWVWRQRIEATAWGRRPGYVPRDRDAVCGRAVAAQAAALGIAALLTPFRAPRADAIAERVVRTLRRECLDHVLVLNERHLGAVLAECVAYDNTQHPHRSLGLVPPLPDARPLRATGAAPGWIVARPVLGGLHHVYQRAA